MIQNKRFEEYIRTAVAGINVNININVVIKANINVNIHVSVNLAINVNVNINISKLIILVNRSANEALEKLKKKHDSLSSACEKGIQI